MFNGLSVTWGMALRKEKESMAGTALSDHKKREKNDECVMKAVPRHQIQKNFRL